MQSPDDGQQDVVWKYVLPGDLQEEVLTYLQRHNITAFSLFGSKESLMQSLAVEEFILRKKAAERRGAGTAKE